MGSIGDLAGAVAYLDANIFIYLLEGFSPIGDKAGELFAEIDAGRIRGVTSELTLAELLAKPIRDGNAQAISQYQNLLSSRQGLEVTSISRQILLEAARLRGSTPLKLPDAIHVATATLAGCTVFISNDKRLAATAIPVYLLSDGK